MTGWRSKAAVAIVILGIASLIFSLRQDRRLSNAPSDSSIRLSQKERRKRQGFKDFHKLRSDPVREKHNAGPHKKKKEQDILKLRSDPARDPHAGLHKDLTKERIHISTEAPKLSLEQGHEPPHSAHQQHTKLDGAQSLGRASVPVEAHNNIKDKMSADGYKKKVKNFLKKKKTEPEVEPKEFSMVEQLEKTSDSLPNDSNHKKKSKKRSKPTKIISQVLAEPRNVTCLEQLEALVDDRVSKTRLTPEGQIDWKYYDAIELYHTRKAGGTSLFAWAKWIGHKHGLPVHQIEGNCFDPRNSRYINRRVLIFTSLRPPIERTLSSYEYDVVQTSKKAQNTTLLQFFDRANHENNYGKNQRDVWQFKKEYANLQKHNRKRKKHQAKKATRGWVWQCATNCYSKWFGGWPTPNLEADTYNAVDQLNHLEVVWMKNLDNPDYLSWLLHRFNATELPLPQLRVTSDKAKNNYTSEDLEVLETANQKDQWLYEVLRRKWSRITSVTLV